MNKPVSNNSKQRLCDIKNPRAFALELLIKAEKSNGFSNLLLDNALEGCSLSSNDRALACTLFYGVIEKRITLDYQISSLATRPLDSIDAVTLNAMRLGLYQLVFLDKVPPHAAIFESVELCPKKSSGFANAILRSFLRSGGVKYPDEKDITKHLSVKFSVCEELVEKLVAVYGKKNAVSMLSAFNQAPDTTLRVNTLKASAQELSKKIKNSEPCKFAIDAIKVRGSVRSLYGFDEGLFFVQDEASQLCVKALDARAGQRVIDICACPGSKSFGAAIDMKNQGEVLAFDLHEKKLSLIDSGAKRLGIDIIKSAQGDGRKFLPELEGTADRVLCDVPCSGFGVISKKPELRYKNPEESAALPSIQYDILCNASRYVKSGGFLVYSTCTVLPEENERNIKNFLSEHSEFSLVSFSADRFKCDKGYITLLPDRHGTDGFFIAKLKRN